MIRTDLARPLALGAPLVLLVPFAIGCVGTPATPAEPAAPAGLAADAPATPAELTAPEAADPAPPGAAGATPPTAADGSASASPWTLAFLPPPPPRTDRLRLEVLGPEWTELDYEALMGSREHLLRTLHWGSWPRANFTLEENRSDLVRHRSEYDAREGFAYTVLDPDAVECLGCIYLNPARSEPRSAVLALWVIEPELESDLDAELLATVVDWLATDWPLDRLYVLLHTSNTRGVDQARAAGFTESNWVEPEHVILERALE